MRKRYNICKFHPKLCTKISKPGQKPIRPGDTESDPSDPLEAFMKSLNESEQPLTSNQCLTLALMFAEEQFDEEALFASSVAVELTQGSDYTNAVMGLQLQAKALEKLQDVEGNKLALNLSERLASVQVIHQQLNNRLLERQ